MTFRGLWFTSLDRQTGPCLICGAPACSCQSWLAAIRPPEPPSEPRPTSVEVTPKTYTRPKGRR